MLFLNHQLSPAMQKDNHIFSHIEKYEMQILKNQFSDVYITNVPMSLGDRWLDFSIRKTN